MKTITYTHPQPLVDRASQLIALTGAALLILAVPLLVLLVLIGAPGGFLLAAPVVLALALPLLMRTVIAPALTVSDEGLTLHPLFWRDQALPWEAVAAVKPFPLLPSADAEATRRIAVGRLNYSPADGVMLLLPGLPPLYRIAGWFAGERGQPVIALTNRAHRDYERLVKTVLAATNPDCHDPALLSDRDRHRSDAQSNEAPES